MRPIVALDTNMLLVPFQFGVDIIDEVQRLVPGAKLVVIRGTISELNRIAKQGVKEKKYSMLAKKLIEVNHIEILPEDGPVDTKLVKLAEKGVIIATNDRELKRRVKEVGGRVIYLREKNRLEMD
jgi:rRNA-processing protein FCF1